MRNIVSETAVVSFEKGWYTMDYEKWCRSAIERIGTLVSSGDCFELKGLFEKIIWETLSSAERRSFGKYFANQVREGKIPDVVEAAQQKDRHNRYQKI